MRSDGLSRCWGIDWDGRDYERWHPSSVSDNATPVGNAPLTATSSGFHYEVYFGVY